MILEEVREKANQKREEIYADSTNADATNADAKKNFIDKVIKLVNNTDYIKETSKFVMAYVLYFIGYDLNNVDSIYDDLMAEINMEEEKVYNVISPEQLKEYAEKSK